MDAYKPVPVANIPPVGFICGPLNQGITCRILGAWDTYISLEVVASMGVLVEEAFSEI